MRRNCLALTPLVLASLVVLLPAQIHLAARMDGLQVVPASNSGVTGDAQVTLDPLTRKITFRVITTCVAPATTYYLRIGAAGSFETTNLWSYTGFSPLIIDMYEGQSTLSATLTEAVLEGRAFLAIGYTFFSAFSDAIRGPLLPTIRRQFTATLSGAGAVPPTASTASGSGTITLREPERKIAFDLETNGLLAIGAEIRIAPPGQADQLVVALSGGPTRFAGITDVIPAAAFQALRDGYGYVNLASLAFPTAEIGGPIVEVPVYRTSAVLSGNQVIPGTPSTAQGTATVNFDPRTRVASYDVRVSGMVGTGVQIGMGYPGRAPIASFVLPVSGTTQWTYVTPPQSPALLDYLLMGGFHVQVATSAYPNGEIRGQLVPSMYPYGYGSDSGAGVVRIGYRGEHVLGDATWAATVSNVPTSAPVLLFVSFSNAGFGGLPLPIALNSGGTASDRAYLWIDPTNATVIQTLADVSGAATIPLPLTLPPSAWPALRGLTGYYQWLVLSSPLPSGFSVSDALRVILN